MDTTTIAGLDGQQAADALVSNHGVLVEAEAVEFELAAHWAMLHNQETLDPASSAGSGRVLPGTERARAYGGDGTPLVAEFAAAELGCLIGRGPVAAGNLMANALDVQFRHPCLWAGILARRVRGWQASEVAKRTRAAGLSLPQARWVDAQVADYIATLAWGAFLELVDAKIIEVDPAAAEARRRAKALERFVATGQCNEYGLKTLVAKAQAGDVVFFVAMVDRIAAILALEGEPSPVGVRRAAAIGILANPARALVLLRKYAADDGAPTDPTSDATPDDPAPDHAPDDEARPGADGADGVLDLFGDRRPDSREPHQAPAPAQGGPCTGDAADGEQAGEEVADAADAAGVDAAGEETDDAAGEPAAPPSGGSLSRGDLYPCVDDTDEPGPVRHRCPTCAGVGTVAGDPSLFVQPPRLDPKKLLPAATLYVHMSLEAFTARTGVARAENQVGPITVEQAVEFLAHTHVSVKPVIDLTDQRPVDCYEVPERMREVIHLLRPKSVYPFSGNLSHRKDLDHSKPYVSPDDGGPPGQTDPYRMGPLGRYEHRVKTHARGWRHLNPAPGVYLWRTRHGYWYRVDRRGTHPLGKEPDLTAHDVDDVDRDDTGGRTAGRTAVRRRLPDLGWSGTTPAEDTFRRYLDAV